MANRPRGFGMTAEIAGKLSAKYEPEKEAEAREWMEAIVGEPLANQDVGPIPFHESLKDGTYLCKLANILQPGSVKFNSSKLAFKQMENISQFLSFCERYGLAKTDLFQTVDLYEKQNMWNVVLTIFALGRKAQKNGFDGPVLGPRESTKNVREFSEEQLKAGQNVIGLQMGSNKGASQAGMQMGTQRFINDIKVADMSKEGQGIIGLQSGTNKGASQAGMQFGGQRHINDIKVDDMSKEGQNIIGLQSGTNTGASQAGQNFGKPRGINDI
jgi:hypothetical protein